MSSEDLAAECAVVSDKLNNLLTAVQIKVGILIGVSDDEAISRGLNQILEVAAEAASHSARLQEMSKSFGA